MSTPNHHHPQHLPQTLDYGEFARELADAQYAVGLLQGSQGRLQNATHLIGPLVAKEAAVSSKIEGTQSTSSDIYIYNAGGKAAYADTPVVSNYRMAMLNAIDAIQDKKPLSKHLIKALHAALLKEVRHKGLLGDFRQGPVWIAEREGDPIEKALYIPPEHIHVNGYVDNLLDYIESSGEDSDKILVKAGVAHYQFEAVHPFEDGNGRIGRLLIPIILFYKGSLSLPIVYSSGYFEARSDEYRAALRAVDKTGQLGPWLRFFLRAITEQANETLKLIDSIHDLHSGLRKKYEMSKSPNIGCFIDFIFISPVFTIPQLLQALGIRSRITATGLVESLERDKVITQITDQKGPGGSHLYAFGDLLNLLH